MTAISEALSDERKHSPELVAALLNLKTKLEALPEPLRGPFVVEGLKPYLRSGNGGEVRVKALEWEDAGEEEWTAESLCGSYYLPLIGSRYNVLLNCAGNGGMFQTRLAEALDIDEAKAFCEADNRTRILGELDTKP